MDTLISQLLYLWLGSGHILEDRVKRLSDPEHQEVGCETVSPRNGCINKSISVSISKDMLMWNTESFTESYL